MIDWLGLFKNSLWVIGLAVLLSAISLARYQAVTEHLRFRDCWETAGIQRGLNVGSVLVCAGLALTAERGWEKGLWIVFGVYFMVVLALDQFRHWKRQRQ